MTNEKFQNRKHRLHFKLAWSYQYSFQLIMFCQPRLQYIQICDWLTGANQTLISQFFDAITFPTLHSLVCLLICIWVCGVACVPVSLILPAVNLFIETAASSVISGMDVGHSFIPPHFLCKAISPPQSLYSLLECTIFWENLKGYRIITVYLLILADCKEEYMSLLVQSLKHSIFFKPGVICVFTFSNYLQYIIIIVFAVAMYN